MGKKRGREEKTKRRKKAKMTVDSDPQWAGTACEKGGIDLKNRTHKRMKLCMGDLPIRSKPGLETELQLGLPLKSIAGASSNQRLPCCDLEFRQILESKNLIINYRQWASNSILGRYDQHFGVYPWYRGSYLLEGSNKEIGFSFTISEVHCDKEIMEASHVIRGKEVKIKRTIMVTGIPNTVNEGEFKKFFSQFGNIIEHEVVLDPNSSTNRVMAYGYTIQATAYGFVIFDSDEAAAFLAAKKSVDFAGVSVSIKTSAYDDADLHGWFY